MNFPDIVSFSTITLIVFIPIALAITVAAEGDEKRISEILGKILLSGGCLLAVVAIGWPIVWFISLFIPDAPSMDIFFNYVYCMLVGFISVCIIGIIGAIAAIIAAVVWMIWGAFATWFR